MANNIFNLFGDTTKDSNAEPGDDDANSFFTEFDDFLNNEIGSASPSPQGNNIQSSYNDNQPNHNTTNFSLTSIDDPITTPTRTSFESTSNVTTNTNTNTNIAQNGNNYNNTTSQTQPLSQHLAQHATSTVKNKQIPDYYNLHPRSKHITSTKYISYILNKK